MSESAAQGQYGALSGPEPGEAQGEVVFIVMALTEIASKP